MRWDAVGAAQAHAQVGDPHRRLVVARHCRHIGLVVGQRTLGIGQVQVAQHAEIAARMVVAGIDRQRRPVTAPRFGKPSGLAIDDAELVVHDRVIRVQLQRREQVLLGRLEIA